jgi:signal transduction histidine kinase
MHASIELDALSLAQFLGLDAADRAALAQAQPLIERSLGPALDRLYSAVRGFGPALGHFVDEEHLARARQAQLQHWQSLISGDWDHSYELRAKRIGAAHARIGLDHRLYLSGYALVLAEIGRALGDVGQNGADDGADSASMSRAQSALLKCAMLDMSMVITAYLEALAAQSTAKSRFLANMSSDLRAPLHAMIGYAELALEELPPTLRIKQDIGQMLGSANRLLSLVNGLLDLSKIETGVIELTPDTFDPIPFTQAAVDLVADEASRKGNSLDVVVEGDVGLITIDPDKLGHCLNILLNNAVRFTNNGAVCVRISRQLRGNHAVVVHEVRDTGVGMTAEQVRTVFGDASFSKLQAGRAGGAGLGLAIARGLAKCLGGDLSVETEKGKGATFTLTVPVRPAVAQS